MPRRDDYDKVLGDGRELLDSYKPYIEILDKCSDLIATLAQHHEPLREQTSYEMLLPALSYGELPPSIGDYLDLSQPSSLSVTFISEQQPEPAVPIVTTSLELTAGERTLHLSRDNQFSPDEDKDYLVCARDEEPAYIPRVAPHDITYLLLLAAGHTAAELKAKDLSGVDILAPESVGLLDEVVSARAARLYYTRTYHIDTAGSVDISYDETSTNATLPTETVIRFAGSPIQLHVRNSSGLGVELKMAHEFGAIPIESPDEGDLMAARERIEELIVRCDSSDDALEVATAPNQLDAYSELDASTPESL